MSDDQMKIKGILDIPYSHDLYKLIDFLNKNLKEKDLIFGLAKKDDFTMTVTIYETD